MTINVIATPMKLSWLNFTVVSNKIPDPNDGKLMDAVTAFNFKFPGLPPKKINGKFTMADPNTITITPAAKVFSGVTKTAKLLEHEQFHYDVGIATARALARHIMRLKFSDEAELKKEVQKIAKLHLSTRAGLLQKRYDLETKHGTNSHYQKIWTQRMNTCLANPKSNKIDGFWL